MAAGERAAGFFTLVTSAVRNDLDVWAYVKDILDQLLAGETDYGKLDSGRMEGIPPGSDPRVPCRGTPRPGGPQASSSSPAAGDVRLRAE